MVVTDGDGVIVVRRARAETVADTAGDMARGDKAGRRDLYEKLGQPIDAAMQ